LYEQTDKIIISESNLSDATKKDYNFRLVLFYRFAPLKSDDEFLKNYWNDKSNKQSGMKRYKNYLKNLVAIKVNQIKIKQNGIGLDSEPVVKLFTFTPILAILRTFKSLILDVILFLHPFSYPIWWVSPHG